MSLVSPFLGSSVQLLLLHNNYCSYIITDLHNFFFTKLLKFYSVLAAKGDNTFVLNYLPSFQQILLDECWFSHVSSSTYSLRETSR